MAYTKQTWNDRDEISDARLNSIEDALVEYSKETDKNTDLIDNLSGNFDGYVQLVSGDNLNDKLSSGWYVCTSSATSRELENTPVAGLAFVMNVFNTLNARSYIQIVIPYNIGASATSRVYIRYYYNGTFGDWKSFSFE